MSVNRAWIDTGALLALASSRDQHHARAVEIATRHMEQGGRWTSSVLVLAEFHRQMLYRSGSAAAGAVLRKLLSDSTNRWLDASASIISIAASNWLERFRDQKFSLTDAVSFELMTREKLGEAFAFDHHFMVAGFSLLG